MNMTITQKEWEKKYQDICGTSITHKEMKGVIGDHLTPNHKYFFPFPLLNKLVNLPYMYHITDATYAIIDNDLSFFDKVQIIVNVHTDTYCIEVVTDHIKSTIEFESFVRLKIDPSATDDDHNLKSFISFVHHEMEEFIREYSPNRLLLVTNTYKYI